MFNFSKALAEAKDKSGLNYEQFAEKIGVSATALRRYIGSEITPSLLVANMILTNLGIFTYIGKADADVVAGVDDFHTVLRQQREAAGMSIGNLARVTFIGFEVLRRLEAGKTKSPQLITVEVLCKTLGIKAKIGRAKDA